MKRRYAALWGGFLAVGLSLAGAAPAPSRPSSQDPRADFLKLIERPRVPLAAETHAIGTVGGITEFRFTYVTEKGQTVPGMLVKQAAGTGRRPVVVALHGTNGKKEDEGNLLRTLAARGFIGIAIDGRYHGERAVNAPKEPGMNAYETACFRAWQNNAPEKLADTTLTHEHPFFFDGVWDIMRLMDYLETRDDVDANRVGLYGVSKGGIEAYLAIAADPRIAAAVPCISVESFRWANDNNTWQARIETIQKSFDAAARASNVQKPDAAFVHAFYARLAPGIEDAFDGPSIIPLAAPRPLMAINGEKDPRTPPASLKLATDAIEAAYKKANAEDHFVLLVQPNTAHRVNPESEKAAVEFLVKWLKPG